MHAAHNAASHVTPSGSCAAVTMSASARRPPGPQRAGRAREHRRLVGRKVDDAVGNHAVYAGVVDWRVLDVALAELGLREAVLCGEVTGLGQLGGGHVNADDAPVGPGGERGEEAVGARATAEVEHRLSGRDRRKVEEVADAGERVDRAGRDPVQPGGRVAEALGERPTGLEVEFTLGLERHPPRTCA
jgi:hypothetical protein